MSATTANEPYEAIQARLTAQTALATALGGRIKRTMPAGGPTFPLLVWKPYSQGLGDTSSDRELYRDELLQIDLFGGDKDQLTDLAALVDAAFNDAVLGGVLDTAHWRITLMARQTAWQEVPYQDRQDPAGNVITQKTSDWRLKALRKQTVD